VTVNVPTDHAVDFSLEKSAIIQGRVTDATGKPVTGTTILAAPNGLGANGTQLSEFLSAGTATATTDQDGRFIIDSGIGKGAYIATASFGNVPVSNSVEVQSGNQVDITLDFVETISIQGRVADARGNPIEGALVAPGFASVMTVDESFAVRTAADGTYKLTIPVKDNSTKSLFDKVAISAKGYKGVTAEGNATAILDRMPTTKITGSVIAQKPLAPSVETVLTRKGTLNFEHAGAQYGVGLQTNARVIAADFDPSDRSITLDLEGVQDAAGRSEFSIPKGFMAGPFAVILDGRHAESATTENQTHTIIAVEHEHDLHQITIQGATAVPELPLPAALAAAGLAATIAWKRLRR
jgi:hypothetical protein